MKSSNIPCIIAYVDFYGSKEFGSWFITTQNVKKILTDNFGEIRIISCSDYRISFLQRVKIKWYQYLIRKTYLPDRDIRLNKSYSEIVHRKLTNFDADVVFANTNFPFAFLSTDKRIVFWSDASFESMIDFYPEFVNLCEESLICGRKLEFESLKKCRLAIYTSQWAAESVRKSYPMFKDKIEVLTWGCSFVSGFSEEQVEEVIHNRSKKDCNLLFVGYDWIRKGGDTVLEILRRLNRKGLKANLTVVGSNPEIPAELRFCVNIVGNLDMNNDNDVDRLRDIYCLSHFLIMPAKAEAFGNVYVEANTFGVPSIGSDVGGVSSAIADGINGKLFKRQASVEEYSDYIYESIRDYEKYSELCMSAFRYYKVTYDWTEVGKKLKKLILNYCHTT